MNNDKILIFGLCGESVFMKVDHFHEEGETIIVNDLYKEPGGKGYNQAVACKKYGIKTCFVTCCGDDEFYKYSKDYLDKLNIENKFFIKKEARSAYATILTDKLGRNRVSVFPGASSLFSLDDLEECEYLFKEYKNILIQLELNEEVIIKIIDLAHEYGCKLFLNPAPYKSFINKYIDKIHLMIPNLSEATSMFGLSSDTSYDKLAETIINNNIDKMIVTLGEDGAMLIENKNYIIFKNPNIKQSQVVDTTGAGDVFCGWCVSSYILTNDLIQSVNYAIKAASYSVLNSYVMPSIPYKCDIKNKVIYQEDKYFDYQEKNNTRYTVRVFAENEEGKFGFLKIIGCDEFGDRNHLESAGGGIEHGECKIDACIREVKEELGYNCKVVDKFCTIIHEFNLINRITVANYFHVIVDTSSCKTNYTKDEEKLFKGVAWYSLDELEEVLSQPNNKVGSLVHERELLALNEFKKYIKI